MKRILASLSFCALSACGGGGSDGFTAIPQALAASQPATPVAEACRVAFYGDSIVRGYYATQAGEVRYLAEPWAAGLKRLLPAVTVEDRSIPGQNMRNVVDGFRHPDPQWGENGVVLPFKLQYRTGVDVVVAESGVIDAWITARDGLMRISELVDYYQNWDAIHRQLQFEGRRLVITGLTRQHVFPSGWQAFITPGMAAMRDDFDGVARRFADERGIPFADIGAAPFYGAADITDSVHPTQAYSTRMLERIVPAVALACAQAGKRVQ